MCTLAPRVNHPNNGHHALCISHNTIHTYAQYVIAKIVTQFNYFRADRRETPHKNLSFPSTLEVD